MKTALNKVIPLLIVLILTGFYRDALAHCDFRYAAMQPIPRVSTSITTVRKRTSVHSSEDYVRTRVNEKYGAGSISDADPDHIYDSIPQSAREAAPNNDLKRQHILMYWLVYVRSLYENKRYAELLSAINILEGKGTLVLSDANKGFDEGDVIDEGYFSLGNLARIFRSYADASSLAIARDQGFSTEYQKALVRTIETQWTTFYYDGERNRSISEKFLPRISSEMLEPASNFIMEVANEKTWKRIEILENHRGILGVEKNASGEIDMYIQAGSVLGLVTLDQESGSSSMYSGFHCRRKLEDNLSKLARDMNRDRNDIVMATLVKAGTTYDLTVEESDGSWHHVYISEKELDQLLSGIAPPGKNISGAVGAFDALMERFLAERKNLIIWSNPMMQKSGPNRDAALLFTHALNRGYPDLPVVMDDPNPNVPKFSDLINELPLESNEIYIVIDEVMGVQLQEELADQIDFLEEHVGESNIVFFDGDEPNLDRASGSRGVIVITGHSDDALESFIDRLAEKGYLKDNFVVLQSCGTELSPKLVSKINDEYGAIGTYHYPEKIKIDDAVSHTRKLVSESSNNPEGKSFGRIVKDVSIGERKNWVGEMRGVWSICLAPRIGQKPAYG